MIFTLGARAAGLTSALMLVAALPATANADCPNVCELSITAVSVEPPLPCAGVTAKPQTCDCAVAFDLGNGCDTEITATDFRFDSCWAPNRDPSDNERDCTRVAPGEHGAIEIKRNSTDRDRRVLTLEQNGKRYKVAASSDVTSLGNEACHCRAPGARRSPPAWPGLLLVLAFARLGIAAHRRRRPRVSSRQLSP